MDWLETLLRHEDFECHSPMPHGKEKYTPLTKLVSSLLHLCACDYFNMAERPVPVTVPVMHCAIFYVTALQKGWQETPEELIHDPGHQ